MCLKGLFISTVMNRNKEIRLVYTHNLDAADYTKIVTPPLSQCPQIKLKSELIKKRLINP